MKRRRPFLVGLTGSIGMGKSTVSKMFESLGACVFNADHVVHALLRPDGKAFKQVAAAFPEAVSRGRIDRKKLGQIVFSKEENRQKLEFLLHPMVWAERKVFLKKAREAGHRVVLLEIPLLFETNEDRRCDLTLCVSATKAQQKERVLKRKGMTDAKLKAILKGQLSNAEKKRRADIVLRTDVSLTETKRQVRRLWTKWTGE